MIEYDCSQCVHYERTQTGPHEWHHHCNAGNHTCPYAVECGDYDPIDWAGLAQRQQ